MEQYELQDNAWLNGLYEIRSQWIPAYFNDIPMAGLLRTTSRSESTNSFFQHFQNSGDTLVQFHYRYENAIEKQRYVNSKNNSDSELIPITQSPLKIEKDAAQLYTRHLYNFVRDEIQNALHFTKIDDMFTIDGVKHVKTRDQLMKYCTFEVNII